MKRTIVLVLLCAVCLTGCGGVWMNAEYSGLLTSTAQLSAETAYRANAGQLTPDEMKQALTSQSIVWAKFVDAKNCVFNKSPGSATRPAATAHN
jgi:hypothetical protein